MAQQRISSQSHEQSAIHSLTRVKGDVTEMIRVIKALPDLEYSSVFHKDTVTSIKQDFDSFITTIADELSKAQQDLRKINIY